MTVYNGGKKCGTLQRKRTLFNDVNLRQQTYDA